MKHPGTLYRGERRTDADGEIAGVVTRFPAGSADGSPLAIGPSLRVRTHSPTGFEWGYAGSGPAQLALALLLDATGSARTADRCYHWFKWSVVVAWGETWEITAGEIFAWVDRWKREEQEREQLEAGIAPFDPGPTCNVVTSTEGGFGHG